MQLRLSRIKIAHKHLQMRRFIPAWITTITQNVIKGVSFALRLSAAAAV